MTDSIAKIDKYAGEIKKLLGGLDGKTEVSYYCEFENEELEEIFLKELENISIVDEEGEEKYLLGNVDTLVEEFFKNPEVIKNRLEFHEEEDDVEDEDDDDEILDGEEVEDDEGSTEDECKILDNRTDEEEVEDDEELEGLDDEAEEAEEFSDEIKNRINFYISLKDDKYINICYIPQFDEDFNITGVEREITLEISS